MKMASNWSIVVPAEKIHYQISPRALWFHNLQHFDYSFHTVSPKFNVTDSSYLESLSIWGVIPLIVLCICWIGLITAFCCNCCKQTRTKRRNICPFQFFLFLSLLLSCSAIGLALYGNENIDRAISNVATSISSITGTIKDSNTEIHKGEISFDTSIPHHVERLRKFIKSESYEIGNRTVSDWLINRTVAIDDHIHKSLVDVQELDRKIYPLNLDRLNDDLVNYEYIRQASTIAIQCWKLLLCLLLFLGLLRLSKCVITTFVFLCVSTGLLFAWSQSAIYFASSIGVGDLCYDLENYIDVQIKLDNDVIEYYLDCDKEHTSPFADLMSDVNDRIRQSNNTLRKIDEVAEHFLPNNTQLIGLVNNLTREFNHSSGTVQKIGVLLDCSSIHKSFKYAASNICSDSFDGLFLMLLATTVVGAIFAMMVVCGVCVKNNLRVRYYYIVDEDDPFTPRSMEGSETSSYLINYNTAQSASNTGLYGSMETNPTVINRDSPPPQYDGSSNSFGSPPTAPPPNTTYTTATHWD